MKKKAIKYNQIERGYPIPQICTYRTLLNKMKLGDSLLVKTFKEADNLRSAAKFLDSKCCMRQTEHGYRVWKIK